MKLSNWIRFAAFSPLLVLFASAASAATSESYDCTVNPDEKEKVLAEGSSVLTETQEKESGGKTSNTIDAGSSGSAVTPPK